jgi:8-oxo-dGTP pyrophosphatase MutT (NUDIX family)
MRVKFYLLRGFISLKIMTKKNGNWTIKETKKKFGNDFFLVSEDKVVQPDGKNGKYATIEFVPGVSVLPIDDEDYVYLTKQFRYNAGKDTLEVVAGAVENETPMKAAKRELKEELGITAKELIKLGKIQLDNSIIKSESTQYIARGLTFGETDQDGAEEMKTVKIKFKEAVEKVLSGEITHAPSCVLILKAEKIRSEK